MKLQTIITAGVCALLALLITVWLSGRFEVDLAGGDETHSPTARQSDISANELYPVIVVDEPTFEFGVMEPNTEGTHDFVIRNEGEAPLLIKEVEISCRCTSYEIASRTVDPGEETILSLVWKDDKPVPVFRQTAKIYSTDPNRMLVTLEVKGKIDTPILMMPEPPWDLGTFTTFEPVTYSARIVSHLVDDFEVLEVVSESEFVTARLEPTPAENRPPDVRNSFDVTLEVSPETPIGKLDETIAFRVRDRDHELKLTAPLTGDFGLLRIVMAGSGAHWTQESAVLDLGRVRTAEGKSATLIVYMNAANDQIVVHDVSTSTSDLAVEFKRDDNFKSPNRTKFVMNVAVPPGARKVSRRGDRMAKLTVRTNKVPEINIRVAYVVL